MEYAPLFMEPGEPEVGGATEVSEGPPPRGLSRPRLAAAGVAVAAGLALVAVAGVHGPFRRVAHEGQPGTDGGGPLARLEIAAAVGYDDAVVERELAPLSRHLRVRLAATATLRPVPRVADAIELLRGGEADVAVLPALGCVQALEWVDGARLLAVQARLGDYGEDGVVVCREGHCPADASGVRGHRVCVVDPGDAAGFLAARSWLGSHGVDPTRDLAEVTVSGGHHQALRDLLEGRCDLAALSAAALESAPSVGIDVSALRAFAATGHTPLPCWIATTRIGSQDRDALREALLGYGAEDAARHPGPVLGMTSLRTADSSTYEGVRVVARLEGLLRAPTTDVP